MGRYDHDMPVFTSDGRGGAKKRPASTTGTTPKRRWEPRTAGAETEAWINADILGGEKVQEQLAATKRWQEMERHHVDGIMTSGMTAPTFIRTDTNVRAMQGALGVKEDGVWGPETDAAFSARLAQEEAAAVAELQRLYREAGGTPPQERYYKQSRIDPEIVGKYMTAGESRTGMQVSHPIKTPSMGWQEQNYSGRRDSIVLENERNAFRKFLEQDAGEAVFDRMTQGYDAASKEMLKRLMIYNPPKLPVGNDRKNVESNDVSADENEITIEFIKRQIESQNAEKKRIVDFYASRKQKIQWELNRISRKATEAGISKEAYEELGPIYTEVYDPQTGFFKTVEVKPPNLIWANGKMSAQDIRNVAKYTQKLEADLAQLEKEEKKALREVEIRMRPFRALTPEETQEAIALIKAYTVEDGKILSIRGNTAARAAAAQRQVWKHRVLPLLEEHLNKVIARGTIKTWGDFDCVGLAQKMAESIPYTKVEDAYENSHIDGAALTYASKTWIPSWKNATDEHMRAAARVLTKQNEWKDEVALYEGPSYDQLLPIANEKLERYMSLANSRRTSKKMIQSAWEEYASIPILLTEDTLANPFAVQCAELLSLRTVSNEMQRKQIEAELVMLDKVIEDRDKQRGVVRFWARQVRDALASKLPGEASVPAVVNELAFDLVDWEFSAFASGYDDYEQQFAYFTSVEAKKKANPAEFEGAGNMVSILTEVISAPEAIRDILGAEKPIKELIKMFIQEWGPKLAIEKGKEYITPN